MLTGADWKRIAAAADERLLLLLLPPLLGHAREEAKPGRFCFGRGCKRRWDDQLAASSAHVKGVLLDAPAFEDASDAACVLLAIRKECLGELDGRSVLRPGKVRERERLLLVRWLDRQPSLAGRAMRALARGLAWMKTPSDVSCRGQIRLRDRALEGAWPARHADELPNRPRSARGMDGLLEEQMVVGRAGRSARGRRQDPGRFIRMALASFSECSRRQTQRCWLSRRSSPKRGAAGRVNLSPDMSPPCRSPDADFS